MAYIYQIVNDINGKVYIGKTEYSIEKRWKEHCRDSLNREKENRPLYRAMNKYGIENFHISVIEETDNPEEREIYWIERKGTFKHGYNATVGGDGRKYLDHDLIVSIYQQTKSIAETARLAECHEDSVSLILKSQKINTLTSQEVNVLKNGKIVNQYDLNGIYIKSFPSLTAAAKSLNKSAGVSHISDACKGKRKTAYGFIWKFSE